MKLLAELDALAPLAPALMGLAASAPRAISLAAAAVRDNAAADELVTLGEETFQRAVEATQILWEHDEILVRAGTQLRDSLARAADDPEMQGALRSLRKGVANLWDRQLERAVERALTAERGDLAEGVRVAQAAVDRLLARALR